MKDGEISLHCWYGKTHFHCSADLMANLRGSYGKLHKLYRNLSGTMIQ